MRFAFKLGISSEQDAKPAAWLRLTHEASSTFPRLYSPWGLGFKPSLLVIQFLQMPKFSLKSSLRSQPIVRAISVTTEIWLLPCACWQDCVLMITARLFGLSPFPNWITQLHRDTAMITRNRHPIFPDYSSRL